MMTKVPLIGINYPHPDYPLGQAWEDIWALLTKAQEREDTYVDGRVLADEIAPPHSLAPSTLVIFLSRAASAGYLTKELRPVAGTRGMRARAFYSINTANPPKESDLKPRRRAYHSATHSDD